MLNSENFNAPMELTLEFEAIINSNGPYPERKFINHIINKLDGICFHRTISVSSSTLLSSADRPYINTAAIIARQNGEKT